MELVREILLTITENKETIELDPLNPQDELYEYHIDILKEANLISYKRKFEDMVPTVYVDEPRLTWEGNNYLDNIVDTKVWKETKRLIISKGLELGSVPFSIIKEVSKSYIKDKVGLN